MTFKKICMLYLYKVKEIEEMFKCLYFINSGVLLKIFEVLVQLKIY